MTIWVCKKSDWIIQKMWICFKSLRRRLTFAHILIILSDGGDMYSSVRLLGNVKDEFGSAMS